MRRAHNGFPLRNGEVPFSTMEFVKFAGDPGGTFVSAHLNALSSKSLALERSGPVDYELLNDRTRDLQGLRKNAGKSPTCSERTTMPHQINDNLRSRPILLRSYSRADLYVVPNEFLTNRQRMTCDLLPLRTKRARAENRAGPCRHHQHFIRVSHDAGILSLEH